MGRTNGRKSPPPPIPRFRRSKRSSSKWLPAVIVAIIAYLVGQTLYQRLHPRDSSSSDSSTTDGRESPEDVSSRRNGGDDDEDHDDDDDDDDDERVYNAIPITTPLARISSSSSSSSR